MIKLLGQLVRDKKLLILGFGKEGQSTYRYIRKHFPGMALGIADRNPDLASYFQSEGDLTGIRLFLGDSYLQSVHQYGVIIKSPGISLPEEILSGNDSITTSQTRLMLEAYHRQIIGVTGTKGKSTTSSLVNHLLGQAGMNSILVGNIGKPPFDYLEEIKPETHVVYEMSSHQLEDTVTAPHISVLLNLYPEHLDRYGSLEDYYNAKMKILTGQQEGDVFIYHEDIPWIVQRINLKGAKRDYQSFAYGASVRNGCFFQGDEVFLSREGKVQPYTSLNEDFALKGKHNRLNAMAAILAARSAGAGDPDIREGLSNFKGLEHRLEYVGEFRDIKFYNDSIATIPEATIAAVDALPDTDTLILGGYDRMLDYSFLIDYLSGSGVRNFIFLGKAGMRMFELFEARDHKGKNLVSAGSMAEAFKYILALTAPGKICLLSPAAASYDSFTNFEERGQVYKKLARSL